MSGIAFGASFLAVAAFGLPAAIAVAAAAAFVQLASPERRRLALPAVVVLLAAALGAGKGGVQGMLGASDPAAAGMIPNWADDAFGFRGRIATPPRASGTRQGFNLGLIEVQIEPAPGAPPAWEGTTETVCASAPVYPVLQFDDPVRLSGEVIPVADLPGGLRGALAARGCQATLFATWAAVEDDGSAPPRAPATAIRRWAAAGQAKLTLALRRAVPGDAGALLAGLVTGDDYALSGPRRDAFLRTGTTHVTAVSGANVALVVAAATALARAGGWRRRLMWQLPTLSGIWGYALLTGLGSPVARAALVASGVVLAARVGRRPDLLTLTVLAAAAMVAAEPEQLRRASFQLSFASALALVAVFAAAEPSGIAGWAAALLKASVAAQIATLPIVLATFGTLSLVSLPANLLVGPLVALTYPLAALAGPLAVALPVVGAAAAVPAGLGASAVLAVVDVLGASERAVWSTGRISPAATGGLTLLIVAAIAAMSPEARACAVRAAADWEIAAVPRRWSVLGAAVAVSFAALALALVARGW